MAGGTGNDTYYVQEALDTVSETDATEAGGSDIVYSAIDTTLGANVEYLQLYGAATQGTGNSLGNLIAGSYSGQSLTLNGLGSGDQVYGGAGNDSIDGEAGADVLAGSGGADTFVFVAGEGNGDDITDFDGAGAGQLDGLRFVGYGSGATFTQIGATNQWQVNYGAGLGLHDVITFGNNANVHAGD